MGKMWYLSRIVDNSFHRRGTIVEKQIKRTTKITYTELVKTAFSIYTHNFLSFLMICLIVNVPINLLSGLMGPQYARQHFYSEKINSSLRAFNTTNVALYCIIGFIATIAVMIITSGALHHIKISAKEALKRGLQKWLSVVLTGALGGVLFAIVGAPFLLLIIKLSHAVVKYPSLSVPVAVGGLLLLFPFVYALTTASFFLFAGMQTDKWYWSAFLHARTALRGYYPRTILLIIVISFVKYVIQSVTYVVPYRLNQSSWLLIGMGTVCDLVLIYFTVLYSLYFLKLTQIKQLGPTLIPSATLQEEQVS